MVAIIWRVSFINCLGDSSIQTTGELVSYGRLYTSRTLSIGATKLPFCLGGITHCCFLHGLISFFLTRDESSHMKYFLCNLAQPFFLPASARTIWQNRMGVHYNLRLPDEPQSLVSLLSINTLPLVTIQCCLDAFFDKTFLYAINFSHADI